jgi:hypothetical protein
MGAERKSKYYPDPDQIQQSTSCTINDLREKLNTLRWVQGMEVHLLGEDFVQGSAEETHAIQSETGGGERPPGVKKPAA